MRIAVINPYGVGGVYSGPALFAKRLFAHLSTEHDITMVVGVRQGDGDSPWARRCIPLMTFHRYGAMEQLRWSWHATRWLWRNSRDYDLVHIHGAALFNLLTCAATVARKTDYALVALAARNDLSAASKMARVPGVARLRRFLVGRAKVGFALSEDIAGEFIALGLEPPKVVALPNPVDASVFAPPRLGPIDLRAGNQTLGFIGMLGSRKRPDLVLDALALLRERGFGRARAVFVGPFEDLRYEQAFRSHVSRLRLGDAVELVGYTTDVSRWTNRMMSVLVHPSSMEGLPGALVEAMASGLPAVVTDVGAMGAVVREAEAGFVVPPQAHAIAESVCELWRDDTVWAKLSAAARTYACTHFDVSSVAQRYVDALTRDSPKLERNPLP